MDFGKLNEILKDFSNLRYQRKSERSIEVIKTLNEEEQGEYGQKYETYHLKELGLWVRLDVRTDSYGENEYVHGMSFVKPVEKTVTVFEKL